MMPAWLAAVADAVIGQVVGTIALGERFSRWIHGFFATQDQP